MPVYNVEPFVEQAIRSILAQTFSDFELIVVDDGSTDGTPAMVAAIPDPRIRLLRRPHAGYVAAMNAAVSIALSEYLVRADGDDLVSPTLFQHQLALLDSHPEVAAVGAWVRQFGGREESYHPPTDPHALRRELRIGCALSWPVMIRRSALDEVGGFRPGDDWDLWIRLSSRYDLRIVPEVLILRRYRPDSVSNSWTRFEQRRNRLGYRLLAARMLGVDVRSLFVLARNIAAVPTYRVLERFLPPAPKSPHPEVRETSISVVVPSFGRPAELERCLQALERQDPPADEVIVVFRPEDDATAALLSAWHVADPDRRKPIQVHQPGIVHALAAGTEVSRSDVVAYLDDDAVPRSGWLAELRLLFLDPTVGAAGGRVVDHVEGREVEGRTAVVGRVAWYGRVLGRHHLETDHHGDVHWLTGSNMAIRRSLAAHDGRLRHTSYGLALANDLDVCLTVRRLGYRVLYSPWAVVDHHTTSYRDPVLGTRVGGEDVATSAANHTYVVLRFLSPPGRLAFLAYSILMGSSSIPGPGRFLLETLRRPRRAAAMARRMPGAWRGRREGIHMYRQWVRECRQPNKRVDVLITERSGP